MRKRFAWMRWLPGLVTLGSYRAAWLPRDIVAGIVLTTMLVPVGIAYAAASGLPGIYGLYATIVPLLAYAVFGPSRILVLGPDSSLAAVILGVVLPLSHGDPARAVALAGMMAVVSGAVCILVGIARLGFVTDLLSKPIRYGYMNGIALTVLIGQMPKLLGFSIAGDGPVQSVWQIGAGVFAGKTNGAACAIGIGALATILALKNSKRIPGILVAVIGATAIAWLFELGARTGLSVLGPLPRGLPVFALPWITQADIVPVLLGGCAVAVVSFADTSVLSRAYAARLGDKVDANQEMVGLGAANLAAGLFQGFPISSSASRTPVAEAAGARTQLTGVVGALGVALLIVAAPNLLRHLPTAALAAVVIASAVGLFEIGDLLRIYRIQRWEFWLSIVCSVGVAVFGAIPGIGLAIAIAVIEFLWDGWRPHSAVLGRADGVRGFHDITRYPEARQVPGLVLFRWDAPLFFANAELFRQRVLDAVAASPTEARWVAVTAEPVTSVDVTAADVLTELHAELIDAGIELRFAELKDPVKDKLKRFGVLGRIGDHGFFPTIGAAVAEYLDTHSVEWVWEERPRSEAAP
jgi:high affinity sulfate transporter 1